MVNIVSVSHSGGTHVHICIRFAAWTLIVDAQLPIVLVGFLLFLLVVVSSSKRKIIQAQIEPHMEWKKAEERIEKKNEWNKQPIIIGLFHFNVFLISLIWQQPNENKYDMHRPKKKIHFILCMYILIQHFIRTNRHKCDAINVVDIKNNLKIVCTHAKAANISSQIQKNEKTQKN